MPRFSANLSFLYQDLPLLDRFAAAAADGFKAIECAVPYDASKEDLAERLGTNGLEPVLFNLPAGNWAGGERGTTCLPDRIDEFRAGVATAIEYATALGCTRLNAIAGIAPVGADPKVLEDTLVANLVYAAPRLADAGIRLLMEPINTRDIPRFFVPTVAMAERIMERVGSDNLFIQYDIYHQQVMSGDLIPTFARLQSRIAHVQVADNPGRHEPGTGEINYRFIFSELDRLGYDGWVGAEYRPVGGTSAGLGWRQSLA